MCVCVRCHRKSLYSKRSSQTLIILHDFLLMLEVVYLGPLEDRDLVQFFEPGTCLGFEPFFENRHVSHVPFEK